MYSVAIIKNSFQPGTESSLSKELIMFIEYNSPRAGGELTTLSVVGTDCIGSYKFNYHAITMTPHVYIVLTNVYTCTVRRDKQVDGYSAFIDSIMVFTVVIKYTRVFVNPLVNRKQAHMSECKKFSQMSPIISTCCLIYRFLLHSIDIN
jgi:hypothetical protein